LRSLFKIREKPGKRKVRRHDYGSYWNCNIINSVTCLVWEGMSSQYLLCCKVYTCGALLTLTVRMLFF
jgi:hypothetical protein